MVLFSFSQTLPQLDVILVGINYREWSSFIHLLFDSLDFFGHIDGT